ncbi:MAG: O-antigen ligase family protein [Mariprofundaceae bacterium]|nr:O-antigen ligase family protein [Mariprofundaceae bacterium]
MLYIACIWIVFRTCQSSQSNFITLKSWAWLIIISANIYVIYALIQYFDIRFLYGDRLFPIWNIYTARFPGPLGQANEQGLFLMLALIPALRKLSQPQNKLWLLASILPLTSLFLTAGRMTVITFSLVVVLLFISSKEPKRLFKYLLFLFAATAITYFIIASIPVHGQIESALSRIESSGLATRLIIWDMSIRLFLEHPWFGIGLMNMQAHAADGLAMTLQAHPEWKDASSQLASGHIWTHNLPLQLTLGLGISGIFISLFLYLYSIRNIFYLIKKADWCSESFIHGSIASFAILIHGLVSVAAMQPFIMVLLAVYLAACSKRV